MNDEELVEFEKELIKKKEQKIIEKHTYLSGKDLLRAI
jgi:hypothetical protein